MIRAIFIKEQLSFFRSPIAYVIGGLFTLVIGWMFFSHLTFFIDTVQKAPASTRHSYDFANEVIIKIFGNVNFLLLFLVPILTMKSFSEEFNKNTIDLFDTSPISDLELVLGKYLSVCFQGAVLILLTLIYPLLLSNLDLGDTTFVISGYMGLFLNLISFISLGILASSICLNSVISCLLGFVLNLFVWMFGWFGTLSSDYLVSEIFKFLSVNYHYQNFVNGSISISDISYYFSFITISLLCVCKRLEVRKWSS